MQTAVLVGGILPASVQQVESFNEINLGAWEGLTVNEVRRRFPGEYDERGRDRNFFGPLLVVAHAGVNRVLLSRLQQRPLRQLLEIPQDYCGSLLYISCLVYLAIKLQQNQKTTSAIEVLTQVYIINLFRLQVFTGVLQIGTAGEKKSEKVSVDVLILGHKSHDPDCFTEWFGLLVGPV